MGGVRDRKWNDWQVLLEQRGLSQSPAFGCRTQHPLLNILPRASSCVPVGLVNLPHRQENSGASEPALALGLRFPGPLATTFLPEQGNNGGHLGCYQLLFRSANCTLFSSRQRSGVTSSLAHCSWEIAVCKQHRPGALLLVLRMWWLTSDQVFLSHTLARRQRRGCVTCWCYGLCQVSSPVPLYS